MIYEVDESLLVEYRRLFEKYSTHNSSCSYFTIDVCDCGYSQDIASLKTMFEKFIKARD